MSGTEHVCGVCRERFQTGRQLADHTCHLGEKFWADAIPRWRAAGVHVHVQATNNDGRGARPREEQDG